VDGARHFYATMFGWTFSDAVPADAPGTYLIASLDDAVAAIGPPRGEAPVEWNIYVAVDDADAAAASVRAAGGGVTLARRRGAGRSVGGLCRSTGCTIPPVAAAAGLGAQVTNTPVSWNFSDLHTGDAASGSIHRSSGTPPSRWRHATSRWRQPKGLAPWRFRRTTPSGQRPH
jgi:uncharacterized protein